MPSLRELLDSPEQRRIARRIVKYGRRTLEPGEERQRRIKAAIETGLVESDLHNLAGGDGGSAGWRQERSSLYSNPRNVKAGIRRFFKEAEQHDRGQSAGRLAADVQRPAAQYRGRYGERAALAKAIIAAVAGGGGGGAGGSSRAGGRGGATASAALSGFDPGSGSTGALAPAAVASPLVASASPLRAPSFTAGVRLPSGFARPSGSGAPAGPKVRTLSDALAQVKMGTAGVTFGDPSAPKASTSSSSAAPAKGGGKLGQRLKGAHRGSPVIGGSVGGEHGTSGLSGYTGKDYFAKAGAAAVAPVNGKIVRLSGRDPKEGAYQGAGGPLGWSLYIKADNGKTYFLTHMGSRTVKVGQRVKVGQKIGTVANYDKYGRPSHIHMGHD